MLGGPGFGAPIHTHSQLPAGPCKRVVERVCSQCHSLNHIDTSDRRPAQCNSIVSLMVLMGAMVQKEEIDTVVDFLASSFCQKTSSRSKSR